MSFNIFVVFSKKKQIGKLFSTIIKESIHFVSCRLYIMDLDLNFWLICYRYLWNWIPCSWGTMSLLQSSILGCPYWSDDSCSNSNFNKSGSSHIKILHSFQTLLLKQIRDLATTGNLVYSYIASLNDITFTAR
jgi:hypothetical protein